MRRVIVRTLIRMGHTVVEAEDGQEAWSQVQRAPFDLIITDITMPMMDGLELVKRCQGFDVDLPVLVLSGQRSIHAAVQAIQVGAYDYLQKPVEPHRLQQVVAHVLAHQQLTLQNTSTDGDFHGMVGRAPSMRLLFQTIRRIARYDTPVLVQGESGTGKELVASALHQESTRSDKPIVAFNIAGITPTLLESTLFGHRKGAFTGATSDRIGLIESADGGTLVLDEIGDLSLESQVKLLRVLESGEVLPVGALRPRALDFRLVACTHRELKDAAASGEFREDLYYRLRGVVLRIPPLRERTEDIPALAMRFLQDAVRRYGLPVRGFEHSTLDKLDRYPWPGNVRELRHVVTTAAIMANQGLITIGDLQDDLNANNGTFPLPTLPSYPEAAAFVPSLDDTIKTHILRVLQQAQGNRTETAKLLGVSRNSLYRLLDKYELR